MAQHHTASSRERGRRKKQGGEGSHCGTGPRRSQERRPDQLHQRSCSARHCITSSWPRLATTPPSYHHEPYGEPHRSPLTMLAVLAMDATAFPHLGNAEAEHSRSWTCCTRTARAQAQGLASPTPSGLGTSARPHLASAQERQCRALCSCHACASHACTCSPWPEHNHGETTASSTSR